MTLKEIFENKDFTNFREKELDKSDIQYFLSRLKNGKRIYDVLPYLNVVKDVPIEFLKPIVEEAMEYEDISAPKRWMGTICRLFTPEKVQETILNKIINTQNLSIKCRAASILYCVGGFVAYNKGKLKGGIDYKWNGERFETVFLSKNLLSALERRKKFNEQRIKILATEFKASENIVFKYFLKRYLPNEIEEYPFDIREIAKEVVNEISHDDFPTWVNPLLERVNGNSELEKLLFEDLNWRKK